MTISTKDYLPELHVIGGLMAGFVPLIIGDLVGYTASCFKPTLHEYERKKIAFKVTSCLGIVYITRCLEPYITVSFTPSHVTRPYRDRFSDPFFPPFFTLAFNTTIAVSTIFSILFLGDANKKSISNAFWIKDLLPITVCCAMTYPAAPSLMDWALTTVHVAVLFFVGLCGKLEALNREEPPMNMIKG